MPITDKERKDYLKQVNSLLVCSKKERERINCDLNNYIDDFVKDKPLADIEQLKWKLGSPQDVANEFLNDLASDYIKKRCSLIKIVKIFCVVAIILFAGCLFALWFDAHESHYGNYFVDTITKNGENSSNEEAFVQSSVAVNND